MMTVIQAILPVILCLMVGYGFRRYGGIPDTSWKHLGFLTYYLLMPALEISVLANKPFDHMPWAELLQAVFCLLILVTLLLIVWQHKVRPVAEVVFTSLYQGGIRFNTFIALVLAAQLFGNDGVAAVAVISAVMILLINLLCVLIYSFYPGDAGRMALQTGKDISRRSAFSFFRQTGKEVFTNPLILGCLIGLGLNFSGTGLTGPLQAFTDLMGQAALPLAIMAGGAGLYPEKLRGHWEVIGVSSVVQLLLKPALAFLAVSLWSFEGIIAAALLLCFSVPTAPSAYVLALQKGGDYQTMAGIITLQTLASALTLPVVLLLAGVWIEGIHYLH